MRHARSQNCRDHGPVLFEHEAGAVAVVFRGAPAARVGDRLTARPGALATMVYRDDAVVRAWPDGVYVECALQLAEGLNLLLEAAPGSGAFEAALDAIGPEADDPDPRRVMGFDESRGRDFTPEAA